MSAREVPVAIVSGHAISLVGAVYLVRSMRETGLEPVPSATLMSALATVVQLVRGWRMPPGAAA